jgi:hypothetical protein
MMGQLSAIFLQFFKTFSADIEGGARRFTMVDGYSIYHWSIKS